jgi:t-SNARE complex subunit (syntaxin)
MEISSLCDEIMETVYHSAVLHDDPYTQERIVRSEVYGLVETFLHEYDDREDAQEISRLEDRVSELEGVLDDYRDDIDSLEAQVDLLKTQLMDARMEVPSD